MNKITSHQIFFWTFIALIATFMLTGLSLINLLIYGLFLLIFGFISLVYYFLNRRDIRLDTKTTFIHYSLTLLGSLLTFFVVYIIFSVVSATHDPVAIAFENFLAKLFKVFMVAGPVIIIFGQVFFVIAIIKQNKIKNIGNADS